MIAPKRFHCNRFARIETNWAQKIYFHATAFLTNSPGIAITSRISTGTRKRIESHIVGTADNDSRPPIGASIVANPPNPKRTKSPGRVMITETTVK